MRPPRSSGYIPLNAQTAKFVVMKNINEDDRTTGTTTIGRRNLRAPIARHGGRAREGGETPMRRQSYEPSTRSLSSIAVTGTANARLLVRNIMPANIALAATGVKFGACGNSRAATSSPTSAAANGTSVPRTPAARRISAIKAITIIPSGRSFPLLRRVAPEHHVERLHFVGTEASISIHRIDPELPVFLGCTAALVRDVVDLGQER